MYEQYLNLSSRPFMSTPYVDHYFPGQAIQKSLSSARICLDRGTGPVLVIGAAGTGKSLLLAMLNEQYRSQYNVVNLTCSSTDRRQEFLQNILFELQLPFRGLSEGELRLGLMDFLRSSTSCPNGLLLLIDEANNLNIELLDEVRLISNFVRDGQPRARMVMAGNMRLEESLNDPRLQSLNQRIASRCYLGNLSKAETADYVLMHIDRAGGDGKQLFTADSLESIYQLTEGCPRFVNQLCDHAMILAVTNGKRQIDAPIIRESWNDLQCFPDVFGGAPAGLCNNRDDSHSVSSNDWSVIEFGSLDDSDDSGYFQQSNTATTISSEVGERCQTEPCNSEHSHSENFHFQHDQPQEWQSAHGQSGTQFDKSERSSSESWKWQHSEELSSEKFQSFDKDGSNRESVDSTSVHLEFDKPIQEPEISQPVKPKYFAANPFAENYENVEEVFDRYAPLIAEFNRSSLEITSQELGCLESLSPSDSQMQFETGKSEQSQSHDDYSHDGHSHDGHSHVGDAPVGDAPESVSAEFHQHPDEACLSHVAEEAGSLLRKLTETFGDQYESFDDGGSVSHETEFSVAQPSSIKIRPIGNSSPITFVNQQEERNDSELTQLESLKQVIEEQNRFSAQAFSRVAIDSNDVAQHSRWSIQPAVTKADVSMSAVPNLSNQSPTRDDQDILVHEPSEIPFVATQATQQSDRFIFSPTPVSTGRAERIDYQQLFDQLRNLPQR